MAESIFSDQRDRAWNNRVNVFGPHLTEQRPGNTYNRTQNVIRDLIPFGLGQLIPESNLPQFQRLNRHDIISHEDPEVSARYAALTPSDRAQMLMANPERYGQMDRGQRRAMLGLAPTAQPDVELHQLQQIGAISPEQLTAQMKREAEAKRREITEGTKLLGVAPKSVTLTKGDKRVTIPDVQKAAGKARHAKLLADDWEIEQPLQRRAQGTPSEFLTPSMTTTMQKDIVETAGTIGQLDEIQNSFKDEYQTFAGRAKDWGFRLGDAIAPSLMPEGAKQYITDFQSWATTSYSALNKYIHDVTGAQLSQFEAERIRKAFPDPGDGVWDAKGPTAYRAKAEAVMLDLRRANARRRYALNNGLSAIGDTDDAFGIPLTDIVGIMDNYQDSIELDVISKNPDLTDEEVIRAVDAHVINEFGVSFSDVLGE